METLFDLGNSDTYSNSVRDTNLDQYFTPAWFAEAVVDRFFPDLSATDVVLEPSAGDGRFLAAIPEHVTAVGVEIDERLASEARRNSGRRVITGDFRTVAIDVSPTVVLGNPPFASAIIDDFLTRCHSLLPRDGRVGWVLPAYIFQTSHRVQRYSEKWSIEQVGIPRNVFQGISVPIIFATFRKDQQRRLVGLALYDEAASAARIDRRFAKIMAEATRSPWHDVISLALDQLGGRADVASIYRVIEGNRPTTNQFWREKVRQTLRRRFERVGDGVYERRVAA